MTSLIRWFLLGTLAIVDASPFALERQTTSHAPYAVQCPPESLTRPAQYLGDISPDERAYYNARKPIAQKAFKTWLQSVEKHSNVSFDDCENFPDIAFATSGGGDRSALITAGIIQAYDNREANTTSMSGLYQSFLYHAATSGSNEFAASFERANWPTITNLVSGLLDDTLVNEIRYPDGTKAASQPAYSLIAQELKQKAAAGFKVSLVDVLAGLYGYIWLGPPDGSPEFLMSDVAGQSNFVNHQVPFPIHMTVDMSEYGLGCPQEHVNNSQFEMTPYEFGSWHPGISSFSKIKYLGSMPQSSNLTCVNGFDKLEYLMTCSGNANGLTCVPNKDLIELEQLLYNSTGTEFNLTQDVVKGLVPNPFYGDTNAPLIQNTSYLKLADGGGATMGVSVWPLIHRPWLDVIFVSDNHNSTASNHTNGTLLYNTYVEAAKLGITNMPVIPSADVFVQKGYNLRNVFFGCNTPNTQSIIYMPENNYSFNGTSVFTGLDSSLTVHEINAAVANGGLIGLNNNAADWPLCVACLIMKKTNTTLPGQCQQCFDKYCVN